jgi:hypothetical protein
LSLNIFFLELNGLLKAFELEVLIVVSS